MIIEILANSDEKKYFFMQVYRNILIILRKDVAIFGETAKSNKATLTIEMSLNIS